MSATPIPVPIQEALRDLLGELVSKGCAVDKSEETLLLSPDEPSLVAEYVDADGQVAAVAIADLAFACRSGSALVMMPPSVADEALEDGTIDGDMLDCYREVANVVSRLLNSPDSPHVKLRGLYRAGELMPGETRTLLRDAERRRDYAVSIEEYGEGRLGIAVVGEAA